MDKSLKLILAVLLLLCLQQFPYGFYQFAHFCSMAGFGVIAYIALQRKNTNQFFIFFVLALLFQPFLKVELGKTLWNIVELIVALFLILQVYITNAETVENNN